MIPVELVPERMPQEAIYAPEPTMPVVNPQLFSGDGIGEAGQGLVGPDTPMPGTAGKIGSMAVNMATGNLSGLALDVADVAISGRSGKLGDLPDFSVFGLAKKPWVCSVSSTGADRWSKTVK